jgi:hypothetical protein
MADVDSALSSLKGLYDASAAAPAADAMPPDVGLTPAPGVAEPPPASPPAEPAMEEPAMDAPVKEPVIDEGLGDMFNAGPDTVKAASSALVEAGRLDKITDKLTPEFKKIALAVANEADPGLYEDGDINDVITGLASGSILVKPVSGPDVKPESGGKPGSEPGVGPSSGSGPGPRK